MDYEKKQRLIALCDSMKEYGYLDGVEELKSIFPELAESEDERIRKEIIDYLKQFEKDGLRGNDITPWLAYLEKQKEQKPVEKQMKHLERGFSHGHTLQLPNQYALESLYNDLKKLI